MRTLSKGAFASSGNSWRRDRHPPAPLCRIRRSKPYDTPFCTSAGYHAKSLPRSHYL